MADLAHRFLPKDGVRMQLLMFHVKMRRGRVDDHGIEARNLIRDRNTKFTLQFDAFWHRARVRCIRIPSKAPQANAFCASFIGSCKHQYLNYVVCFGLGETRLFPSPSM